MKRVTGTKHDIFVKELALEMKKSGQVVIMKDIKEEKINGLRGGEIIIDDFSTANMTVVSKETIHHIPDEIFEKLLSDL
jgi:ASC-1-like (ASCH) protein